MRKSPCFRASRRAARRRCGAGRRNSWRARSSSEWFPTFGARGNWRGTARARRLPGILAQAAKAGSRQQESPHLRDRIGGEGHQQRRSAEEGRPVVEDGVPEAFPAVILANPGFQGGKVDQPARPTRENGAAHAAELGESCRAFSSRIMNCRLNSAVFSRVSIHSIRWPGPGPFPCVQMCGATVHSALKDG